MTYEARETSQRSGEPIELYRFTQAPSAVWRSTSADVAVVYNEESYEPAHVIRGAVKQGQERSAGGVSLQLSKSHAVAALYQVASPTVPVWLTVFRFHFGDGEFRAHIVGQLAFPVWRGPTLSLTILPITALLARPVLAHKWQPRCNHALGAGDGTRGCNVDLEEHKVEITVTAQEGRTLTAEALGSQPDGHFAGGKVRRADGQEVMIRSHTGATVELSRPLGDFTAPEEMAAYPGCDGRLETCSGTFDNVAEYAGDPFSPERNPHVSGLN